MVLKSLSRHQNSVSGLFISGVGLILSLIHLLHGISELSETLLALVSGVVIPLLVSLLLLGSGYWVARHDWSEVSPFYLVGWSVGGLVVGIGLSQLLILYQTAEGVRLSDVFFVQAMFATYGGGIGLVLGWYDTERRTQQAEQQRKSERLEEFASIVSHDLRNPLTVAQGRLELALEETDNEHLATVDRALHRMDQLIEDLLTLTRQGESARKNEPVDLAELSKECWDIVATEDARLQVEVDNTILADEVRLKQLLENLLRNAVEHGGDDITVTVGGLEDGFYVEDDGQGIPAEKRSQIFEDGYSTSDGGTGLGLSIVQNIIDAHGWEVHVSEGRDGGARFDIRGVEVVTDY